MSGQLSPPHCLTEHHLQILSGHCPTAIVQILVVESWPVGGIDLEIHAHPRPGDLALTLQAILYTKSLDRFIARLPVAAPPRKVVSVHDLLLPCVDKMHREVEIFFE